ncbi:hypothetical protein [Phenylobacterium sp.]|uniref:hypothetical protein n=1 Tax=Phenylobacterium sp. TaxID=1871053 RepID=UPI00356AC0A0
MNEDLEAQRLAAEIDKLKAETESLRRPPPLQKYIVYAAVVGALSGVAAILQVGLQLRTLTYDQLQKRFEIENQTIDARAAADRARSDETAARATLAAEQQKFQVVAAQLSDAVEKKREANDAESAYRSALAKSVGQKQALAGHAAGAPSATRGVVQIFLRQGASAGSACADLLSRNGLSVGGVEQVSHGPRNDEVKYFWPGDEAMARTVGNLVAGCGLKVPDFNLMLITDDPGSASSPHKYVELWVGTAR